MDKLILKIFLLMLLTGNLVSGNDHKDESKFYWIFFTDKNISAVNLTESMLTDVLSRESIRKKRDMGYSWHKSDLPVHSAYIAALKDRGIKIRRQSRWFNAVTAALTPGQLEQISILPFVKNIQPVGRFKLKPEIISEIPVSKKHTQSDYGESFAQNELIGIPAMHSRGMDGSGIRIALFDTGFRWTHQALSHVNIIAARDFVENDGDVTGEYGYTHGTQVLAILAGYDPGYLIGPAWNAEYILGKTEDIWSEKHVEEDNWVAAAEWADSLGADIISTSVGYNIFDSGEESYTYEDMDGNTAIITRGADMAVKKGMVVIASAGNEGTNSWEHIIAPADGDSVLAIGGTNSKGQVWDSSSRGPSADGRIKPDLMAQAKDVLSVSSIVNDKYVNVTGTSFSSPLAAGAAALVLQLLPGITPMQLADTLKRTATRSAKPDNVYGYGLINLQKLLEYVENTQSVEISEFKVTAQKGRNTINWISDREIFNKYWILERKKQDGQPEKIAEIPGWHLREQSYSYSWSDSEIEEQQLYQYKLYNQFADNTVILRDSATVNSVAAGKIGLVSGFPNPFNHQTLFFIESDRAALVDLKITDIYGRTVKTFLKKHTIQPGFHPVYWSGENASGGVVSSGVYFAVLINNDKLKTLKLIFLK